MSCNIVATTLVPTTAAPTFTHRGLDQDDHLSNTAGALAARVIHGVGSYASRKTP